MGLLELREAVHIDGLAVGDRGAGGAVGHEAVGHVRDHAWSCKVSTGLELGWIYISIIRP